MVIGSDQDVVSGIMIVGAFVGTVTGFIVSSTKSTFSDGAKLVTVGDLAIVSGTLKKGKKKKKISGLSLPMSALQKTNILVDGKPVVCVTDPTIPQALVKDVGKGLNSLKAD